MAKGAKKTKSAFFGQFDASHLLELVIAYKEGREIHTLTESSILDNRAHHQQDLMHGALAALIREVIMKVLHEGEGSLELFQLLNTSLSWLDHQREIGVFQSYRFVGRFIFRLVEIFGFEVQTSSCQNCGTRLKESNVTYFDVKEGGFECSNCRSDYEVNNDLTQANSLQGRNWVVGLWVLLVHPAQLSPYHSDNIEDSLFKYLFGHLDQKPKISSRDYLFQIRQMSG